MRRFHSFARSRGRSLLATGVAGALCVGLVGLATGWAAADQAKPTAEADGAVFGAAPPGFASWTEAIAVQGRLEAAAARVTKAGGAAAGLAGVELDLAKRDLVVYWKGAMPAQTARIIDQVRADVPVRVRSARYSATELAAVSRALVARPEVTSAAGKVDGSGVEAAGNMTAMRTARSTWGTDVPVTMTPDRGFRPTSCGGRRDDCSPYNGGSRYNPARRGFCSTGFAVRHQNRDKMLTAGHCGANGDAVVDGAGEAMGTVDSDNNARDTMMITLPSGTVVSGRIFVGGPTSSSTRSVESAKSSFVGAFVCTGGAATGEHCNVKVDAVDVFTEFGDGVIHGPLVAASQVDGKVAFGTGDSGGSVYVPTSVLGKVSVRGTISAGLNTIPCPGPPADAPRCGSALLYADAVQSLNFYGAAVIVS
ncbi:hypothetical protein [Paractinoplanes rishiriensis]|uniref:Uncharacterized protein n=1 Tax=Paractinoplanes rishiriensis TaxID=1050105 RepID=A0A919N077_9ACTN|nr:hypothetical protein [Actinoplanes rishiriensis]GIF02205.1 hypothetical protein Ari01nite_96690 [Actinoplanes rishiriensis]